MNRGACSPGPWKFLGRALPPALRRCTLSGERAEKTDAAGAVAAAAAATAGVLHMLLCLTDNLSLAAIFRLVVSNTSAVIRSI